MSRWCLSPTIRGLGGNSFLQSCVQIHFSFCLLLYLGWDQNYSPVGIHQLSPSLIQSFQVSKMTEQGCCWWGGSPGLGEQEAAGSVRVSDTRRKKTSSPGLCTWVESTLTSRADPIPSFQARWQILTIENCNTTLPDSVLWCGKLWYTEQASGAKDLMPPWVATEHWLKDLVSKYSNFFDPQGMQLEDTAAKLQESPSGIGHQLPRGKTSLLTSWKYPSFPVVWVS